MSVGTSRSAHALHGVPKQFEPLPHADLLRLVLRTQPRSFPQSVHARTKFLSGFIRPEDPIVSHRVRRTVTYEKQTQMGLAVLTLGSRDFSFSFFFRVW